MTQSKTKEAGLEGVELDDVPNTEDKQEGAGHGDDNAASEEERRVVLQDYVCGFYGLVVFVLGLTFSTADALGNTMAEEQIYVMFFHGVISLVGAAFCLFLLVKIIIQERGAPVKDAEAYVLWSAEGISVPLRAGAIVFGSLGVVMCIVQLTDECRGSAFSIRHACFLILTILQTFVLIRYHKMLIQKVDFLARWGFAHLIATNLSIWAYIVVNEAYENILHTMLLSGSDSGHGDGHGNGHGKSDGGHGNYTSGVTEDAVSHDIHKRAAGLASYVNTWAACDFAGSLQFTLAPYLYPCIIEYVLIMAAICYKLYNYVGRKPTIVYHEVVKIGTWSSKAIISYTIATVLGLCFVVVAVVAVIFIFESDDAKLYSTLFYSAEMAHLIMGIFVCLLAGYRLKGISWRPMAEMLDARLLLMTYFGIILIDAFSLIACIQLYNDFSDAAPFDIARNVMSITQTLIQVALLTDGLARCVATREQAAKKPGQAVVLLLFLLNVGIWILMVFEPKMRSAFTEIPNEYYGSSAWNIIKSVCLPLIIFFRFHSCVCLADIFYETYLFHPHHD